jgi:hypothetical protein
MPTLGNVPRPAYVYDTETDTWVPVGVGAHTHSDIPNTLVDAKGDLITATADNVPARLAKGADGTVLVADSTTSTGLAWQPYGAQVVAGKNFLINGGMDVWQRGTSFAVSGLGYATYTVDRWNCYAGAAGTITQDTSLYAPGARYGLRFTSTVSSSAQNWYQMIETTNAIALAGQNVTLSGYAAGTSGVTGNYLNLWYSTNTDASLFDAGWTACTTVATTLNPAINGTMQRYASVYSVPSNAKSLRVQWTTGTLSNTQFQTISGFQLEQGPVATPFSRAGGTIQGELAACQRYYWRLTSDTVYQAFGMGFWEPSSSIILTFIDHPVVMRVNPTSIDYAGPIMIYDGATGIGVNSISIGSFGSRKRSRINLSLASAATSNRPYELLSNASTTPYLGFNAEL